MANAGGLLLVLLAGLVGLGAVAVSVGLLVYGLVANNPRRGFRASLVALGLSLVASALSTPLVAVVVVEALSIAAAVGGVVRQARRQRRSG